MKLENKLLILPENFEKKIKSFYEQNGKETIEKSAREIEKEYDVKFRTINWDENQGLRNISTSPSSGLDLMAGRFAPHNIYDIESKEAEPLIKIILYYISMLETL